MGETGRIALLRWGCLNETEQNPEIPAQRTPRRRSRSWISRPFAVVAAFGAVLISFGLHDAAPSLTYAYEQRMAEMQGRNTIAQRGAIGEEGALHEEIRRLSMGLDRAARSSAPMAELSPIDPHRIAMPKESALFADEIARFATSDFVEPSAREDLVRHGYPAAVAAVAWLQQQDYAGLASCVAACRVHELLSDLTGVDGLQAEEPFAEPDEPVIRRFRAVASAWRRVLERHAHDAQSFAELVAFTRRGKPVEKKD